MSCYFKFQKKYKFFSNDVNSFFKGKFEIKINEI